MPTAAVQKILQEVFILALGRAANAEELAWLETLAGPAGDYAPLVQAVNDYMSGQAATQGTAALLKTVALHGLGMSLSTTDADAIAADLAAGHVT